MNIRSEQDLLAQLKRDERDFNTRIPLVEGRYKAGPDIQWEIGKDVATRWVGSYAQKFARGQYSRQLFG